VLVVLVVPVVVRLGIGGNVCWLVRVVCPCGGLLVKIPHPEPAGDANRRATFSRRPAPYPERSEHRARQRRRVSPSVASFRSSSPELSSDRDQDPPPERVLFPGDLEESLSSRPLSSTAAERDYALSHGGLEGATQPFPNTNPSEFQVQIELRRSYLRREAALLGQLSEFCPELESGYLRLTDRFAVLILRLRRQLEHDECEVLLSTLRAAANEYRGALVHAVNVNERVNRLEGIAPTLRRAVSRARSRLTRSRDERVELAAWLDSATDRLRRLGFVPEFEEGPSGRFLTWREVNR